MKHLIKTTHTMHVGAEAAWDIVRTGEGVHHWLPLIKTCRLEGMKRFCTTDQGSLEEEILESNDALMRFRYAIPKQNLLPIRDVEGEMRIVRFSESQSTLNWDLVFQVDDEVVLPMVEESIKSIYAMGAAGIEKLASATMVK